MLSGIANPLLINPIIGSLYEYICAIILWYIQADDTAQVPVTLSPQTILQPKLNQTNQTPGSKYLVAVSKPSFHLTLHLPTLFLCTPSYIICPHHFPKLIDHNFDLLCAFSQCNTISEGAEIGCDWLRLAIWLLKCPPAIPERILNSTNIFYSFNIKLISV